MGENALALHATLCCPDREGYLCIQYPEIAPSLPQGCNDVFRVVSTVIHHSQQDAVDFQRWVDLPPYFGYRSHQQLQALGGQSWPDMG